MDFVCMVWTKERSAPARTALVSRRDFISDSRAVLRSWWLDTSHSHSPWRRVWYLSASAFCDDSERRDCFALNSASSVSALTLSFSVKASPLAARLCLASSSMPSYSSCEDFSTYQDNQPAVMIQ